MKDRRDKMENADELVKIYSQYVCNTAITMEYEVPTPAGFRRRIKKTLEY